MSQETQQNYANHRSNDVVLAGLALVSLIAAVLGIVALGSHSAKLSAIAAVLLAICMLVLGWKARTYTLKMQDRIIRLEMRLRLADLLKGDLEGKGQALTLSQLIGLRYASDAELPDLVRKVLAENITKSDDIKKLVKDWQADHMRI
jgi:hypothetical protein